MGGSVKGGKDNLMGMRRHFVNLEPGYKAGDKGALLGALALAKRRGQPPSGSQGNTVGVVLQPYPPISQLLPSSADTDRQPSWASSPTVGGIPGEAQPRARTPTGGVGFLGM